MNIGDRQNYGSSESDLNNDDADYITASRYPNRADRFRDLTFFGRRKSPHYKEFLVIKPSDPALDFLMNYPYYQLYDRTMIRNAEDLRKLREQVKEFQAAFLSSK